MPLVKEFARANGQTHGFASDARKVEDVIKLVDDIEWKVADFYTVNPVIDNQELESRQSTGAITGKV